MACRWIHKVGLAAIENGQLLVVRKRGGSVFILPGGKPEADETGLETLSRELDEELGCGVAGPALQGVFKDVVADEENAVVVVRLYSGRIVGTPKPQAEIEEMFWLDLRKPEPIPLAPSIVNGILPHLRKRLRKSVVGSKGLATQMRQQTDQGILEFI